MMAVNAFRHHLGFKLVLVILVLFAENRECRAEFSLQPGIYMALEATDNLFLTEEDQNKELIGVLAPGVRMTQAGDNVNFNLEYNYEMYRFFDEPDLNDRPDTHLGQLDGAIFPGRTFTIDLGGEAVRESIDPRISGEEAPLLVNSTNRYSGEVTPALHYLLGTRVRGDISYTFSLVEYEDSRADDTESQRADAQLSFSVGATLDLVAAGAYEIVETMTENDYTRSLGSGGFEWRPSDSFLASLRVGRSWFEYRDGVEFDTRLVQGQLQYSPNPRLRLEGSYVEETGYDLIDGLSENWSSEASVNYQGRLTTHLRVLVRESDFVRVVRNEREEGAELEFTYPLSPRTSLELFGDARTLDFQQDSQVLGPSGTLGIELVSEHIDRFSVGTMLAYSPRNNATIECRYRYLRNDSDIYGRDYEENRAICSVQLAFDLIR